MNDKISLEGFIDKELEKLDYDYNNGRYKEAFQEILLKAIREEYIEGNTKGIIFFDKTYTKVRNKKR